MERQILTLAVPVILSDEFSAYECKIIFDYRGWRVVCARVELCHDGDKTLLFSERSDRWQPRGKVLLDEWQLWKISEAVKTAILLLDELMFFGTLANAWGWVPQRTDSSISEWAKCGLTSSKIVALADGRLVRVASGGYEDVSSSAEIMANAF